MTTIRGIFHINVNCADFERSKQFYELVGFQVVVTFPEGEQSLIGRGLGIGSHRVKGALMRIGEGINPAFLDLLQWLEPKCERAMPPAISAVGIPRIALWTSDIAAEHDRLRNAGIEFISEPISVVGPTGQMGRFACFKDPDGNMLELLEITS